MCFYLENIAMNSNLEPTVTITVKEYESLQRDLQWLNAIECAGVDNWEGYEEAMNILEEWENEEND